MGSKIINAKIQRDLLFQKLKAIRNDKQFLVAINTLLDTEDECQYISKAIENGLVENDMDIVLLAVAIDDEREKHRGKGNYLENLKFKKINFNKMANK